MKKSTRLNTRNVTSKLSAALIASAIMASAAVAQYQTFDTGGNIDTNILPPITSTDGFSLSNGTYVFRSGGGANPLQAGAGDVISLQSGRLGNWTVHQLFAGAGDIVKSTDGTVTIYNGNFGFNGDTYIDGGTLKIHRASSLGTGFGGDINIASGGTLELALVHHFLPSVTFDKQINSDGAVVISDFADPSNPLPAGWEVTPDIDFIAIVDTALLVHDSVRTTTISNASSIIDGVYVNSGVLEIAADGVLAGFVDVDAGELVLDGTNQSITGLFGEDTGLISVDNSVIGVEYGVYAGDIVGNELSAIVKHNVGDLHLDGEVYLSDGAGNLGLLEIQDGGVFVNDQVTADVLVTRGAVDPLDLGRLHGTGVIWGNVFNSGIVSPGDYVDAGVLSVAGDYTQSVDGVLGIYFEKKNDYDHLAVGGDANLAGTLVLSRNGKYRPRANTHFTILSAGNLGGDLFGSFDRVVDFAWNKTMLDPIVSYHYDTDEVTVKLRQRSFTSFSGLTPNQRRIGKALNHASRKGHLKALFDNLNYTNPKDVPAKLQLLSSENLTAIFNIGIATAQIQNVNIERRLDDVRAGSVGFDASGLAITNSRGTINYDGAPIANTADGLTLAGWDGGSVVSKEVVAPIIEQSRWGFFATGTGEWVDIENTHDARGEGFRSAGFTLGADYRVSENFVVGLNAGYTNTSADLPGNGSIEVDGGRGGVYATAFGGGAYLNAAVGGGYNSYRTRRATVGGKAHGDTDGAEFNALLGGGYDIHAGGFTFGPTASLQYTYIGLNSFQETGSLAPQDFRNQSQDSLRSLVGLRAAYTFETGGVVIKPEVRASWKHEYLDSAASVSSSFVGSNSVFDADGVALGRDSLVLDAGASVQFNSSVAVYAYYTGELGRTNYESHAVNGGFRVAF